jgi:hypothetical protein
MRVLLVITFLFLSATLFAQTSSVKGVVTYFFNKYQGDKPDLGAKVYLIEMKEASFINKKVIDSFIDGKFYRRLYFDYVGFASTYEKAMKQYEGKKKYKTEYDELKKKYDDVVKERDEHFSRMESLGVETKEKFDSLDLRVVNIIARITDKNSSMITVDATGGYSFNVKPGSYFVYIVSKNRNSLSVSEVSGKIFLKQIEVKDNQTIDVSTNFDLY